MAPGTSATEIGSLEQLTQAIGSDSNSTVLVYFYNGLSKESKPSHMSKIFEAFASKSQVAGSALGHVRFLRVDVAKNQDIAATFDITNPPDILAFRNGEPIPLEALLPQLQQELKAGGAGSSSGSAAEGSGNQAAWLGADLPRSYKDVTEQVEMKRVELLNVDGEKGNVRVLFSGAKPSALTTGKGNEIDWVESDTDEQLLLFMPFQAMLKLHTLQITSIPPTGDDVDEDEKPMRPKLIKLFTNRPTNLGFDQAESTAPTQMIEISESDWNAEGTANIPLRFVKFQNINSLIIFIEAGDGSSESEKVRLDRLRLIGETGEKREMGKLEKIGDEPGE
ncbi:hypothetical protein MCOR25_004633 [Pyricularia grisea]|uniref:PITH domain-containing protein n=1 Tax=Pyricularia grisea TaxID=148305 RepID=A0A6P8ARR9_PYRGI|nr:uncharacterized protein PgNI_09362 [Pyricularia grisea]KAI6368514.1 hypothetical protein MCOR25_004633 [Pyricularia grisea]TLD04826.1 hypothetical protein PgNI_09362 [Pyricularia grisea]